MKEHPVNRRTAEHIVAVLNDLLEHDRPAIAALFANRVPCNEVLADHPTCQCGAQHGGYHVGMLGVLNAIANFEGEGQYGPIQATFKDSDDPREEKKLIGFSLAEPRSWASLPANSNAVIRVEAECRPVPADYVATVRMLNEYAARYAGAAGAMNQNEVTLCGDVFPPQTLLIIETSLAWISEESTEVHLRAAKSNVIGRPGDKTVELRSDWHWGRRK